MTAGETVKLRCINSDGEAAGICSTCREPVCAECIDRGEGDGIVCRNCSYKLALTGVDETQAQKRAAATRIAIESRKETGKARRVVGALSLVIVLGALVGWAGPLAVASFSSGAPYAVGPVGEDDAPGLDDCVAGLWRLRAAMDDYRYRNDGKNPASLSLLEGIDSECPGCDQPWRYTVKSTGFRAECPDPRSHARAAVFLDDRVGPPQVQLDEGGR